MARIRSIHPGLFTDEAFVSLTADAQVFLMGIWTEADDQGAFEWKPLTLRMRLRPTKDGPVDDLLDELEAAKFICRYAVNNRQYGAIRNFRKYQRPKSPNAVHPITDEIRNYVGLTQSISEMTTDEAPSIPRKEEFPPQMEEVGGGKEEKKDIRAVAKATRPSGGLFDEFWKAYPRSKQRSEAAGPRSSSISTSAVPTRCRSRPARPRSAEPAAHTCCAPA